MTATAIPTVPAPGTGLKTLVRGSLLSALSVCISMAALLVTSKLFTNALDQNAVGIFALLLVSSDFIIYATGMGLTSSMPKLVAEADPGRRRRIIGGALTGQLLVLLAAGALVLLIRICLRKPESLTTDPAWLGVHACLHLLPLLFIIGGLRDVIMAMLAGLDRYGFRAGGIALASLAQVILVYIFVWRMGGGVVTLTLAMAVSYGIALVLLWAGLGVNGRLCPDWAVYKEAVRFSMPLYLYQVVVFFNQRFDTVLVSALAGVSQAAMYEMTKRLPVIVNRVMNALLVPYLPHISRLVGARDYGGAARVLHHSVGISAFMGYGAVLFLVAIQKPLIILLFNKEYLAGTAVLGLLLTAASLALQAGLMAQMLIAVGRNMPVPLVNMTAMALTIAADIVIIPRFGMAGAAWVAVAASALAFALLTAFTRKAGVPVKAWCCIKPVILLLLSAFPVYYGGDALWWRLASPVLFVLLCFTFSVVTPRQMITLVRAMIPGRAEAY